MLWLICGSAPVLAIVAVHRVRVLARRLERVKQVQWELSYQVDALTARLEATGGPGRAGDGNAPAPAARRSDGAAIVPLSSLRR